MISARHLLPRFSAFLFDLDGTLIQAPIDFAGMKQSVLDLAARFGLDTEELKPFDILGIVEQAEIALKQQENKTAVMNREIPARTCSTIREEAEQLLTRFEVEAASLATELPGAIATLKELKARGASVVIVTRNCRIAVELTLQRVPLPHDVLLTRNDVRRPKPDPEHLLEAARRLNVSPQQCMMIGDHPLDIQAGHGAGMFSIAVQSRDASPEAFESAAPDLILPGVGDLLSWMSASSS